MRVLIACECSGRVREAFRDRGHDAYSCDLNEPEGEWRYHLRCDVSKALKWRAWDLMIAHPPCTYLTVACNGPMTHGCSLYTAKEGQARRNQAIAFFMAMVNSRVPKIAVENPIGIMSTRYRKPDQIIQPWQFGEPESKATCLWLKGLPKLVPTKILPLPDCGYWRNQTPSRQNKLGPSPTRAADRARTYNGIALAMAEQWGS